MNKAVAQSKPILYFCERYDSDRGEIGVGVLFQKGDLTVMVKASDPLGLSTCYIQYDKYNCETGKYEYYKNFSFEVAPKNKYLIFAKNADNDMAFQKPGIYRVYLLDEGKKNVACGLIEIIN
ncbi:MAG: hypothetical protein NTX03_15560 [Bacteroidetes bacterium]|nr:hypothetical protein [Bacteroidota bacterium]